jgi:small subunit ribosomal protein S19e
MARTIFAQDSEKFISTLAEALKKIPEFEAPLWANFVKTGVSRQRPPVSEDFWHIRAASILRQLYIRGIVGVGRLRVRYGSKKDRGGKPDKFRKASGKIIRVILQQAENAGLVEKVTKLQFGRRLTQKGRDLLDSIDVGEKPMVDLSDTVVHNLPRPHVEAEEDVEEIKGEEIEEDGE